MLCRVFPGLASLLLTVSLPVAAESSVVLKGPWLEKGETLVCYGDSITARPGYFEIISNSLAQAGIRAVNAGRGGDNSATALMRIDEVVAKKADAAMIFFGTNDSAAGRGRWVGEPSLEPETYRDNVLWMIHRLRQAGVRKFSVVTTAGRIEGEGFLEFGNRRELYNVKTREVADRAPAVLVPLDVVFDEARKSRTPDARGRIFTVDGVHLTDEASALAAETMLKAWCISK